MDIEKRIALKCILEMRTPVVNIAGFGELLTHPEVGDLNDKQREYLGDILTSTKTLLSILEDFQRMIVGDGERRPLH